MLLRRRGLTLMSLTQDARVQGRYTPEQGMGMLGLEQVQLFWERSLDTKVLIGWSADTIVISVRGTASLRNAIADIQVRWAPWGNMADTCQFTPSVAASHATCHLFASTLGQPVIFWAPALPCSHTSSGRVG